MFRDLFTGRPRCAGLIFPFPARDTGVEAGAMAAFPAGSTFVLEGDEMVAAAGCRVDKSKGQGEKKGDATKDHVFCELIDEFEE